MTDYLIIAHLASDAAYYGAACAEGLRAKLAIETVVLFARLAARCANRVHYLAGAHWPDDHPDVTTYYIRGELNRTRGTAFSTIARDASTLSLRPLPPTAPARMDLSALSSTPKLRARFGHLVSTL